MHRAAAGGEHRVEHVHARGRQPRWQPLVVVDRDVLLLVAIDPDVTDAGIREQTQEALDHPEAGAQDGHDRDLVARVVEPVVSSSGVWIVDVLERQLTRDLDGHDRRGLEQRLAEVAVGRLTVAHHRQSIGEDGMLDDCERFGHGCDAIRHGASQHRAQSP